MVVVVKVVLLLVVRMIAKVMVKVVLRMIDVKLFGGFDYRLMDRQTNIGDFRVLTIFVSK